MNTKTVLLVEDNPDDVELTLRTLPRQGIAPTVVVAKNGLEALDYLFCRSSYADRQPKNPDVILLDLKLPKVCGIEVLRQIRSCEKTKTIPVVILTTSDETPDKVASYELLANSYIRKPVDFDQFSRTIQQLFFYWCKLNECPRVL